MSEKQKNRGLKTRVNVSNSYDKILYNEIRQLSHDTMIPISRLMDEGMRLVLQKYNNKKD